MAQRDGGNPARKWNASDPNSEETRAKDVAQKRKRRVFARKIEMNEQFYDLMIEALGNDRMKKQLLGLWQANPDKFSNLLSRVVDKGSVTTDDEANTNVKGGVLVVPMGQNTEEAWEKQHQPENEPPDNQVKH